MRIPIAALSFAAVLAMCLSPGRAHSDSSSGRNKVGKAGWSYVLPVDHGIRADRGGQGYFMARRKHGRHNGIDLLAPIGTNVLAACQGEARGGSRGGFGHWAQVVCRIPAQLRGTGSPMFASLFYAHLRKTSVSTTRWQAVRAGQTIGTVGKTGNAIGASIMPHVHLELIIHATQRAAKAERHSGRNQANNRAADRFVKQLRSACLQPNAFHSPVPFRHARRADPFAALTCLAVSKPRFAIPAAPLQGAAKKWSAHYAAAGFDVDVGLPATSAAPRQAKP